MHTNKVNLLKIASPTHQFSNAMTNAILPYARLVMLPGLSLFDFSIIESNTINEFFQHFLAAAQIMILSGVVISGRLNHGPFDGFITKSKQFTWGNSSFIQFEMGWMWFALRIISMVFFPFMTIALWVSRALHSETQQMQKLSATFYK